jgi:flagellar hook protein FlgE
MMSAFFSSVSGLKSQTSNLNVIANNISNVNTTGYKSQRVSFSDLLSQTLSAASGSTATSGGTNPVQVGLGVSVASTDTNMTTGSTTSTGVDTDVAISGEGFFVIYNGADGSYLYTREGDMTVDEDGNLTVNGNKVCGYTQLDADGNVITTGDLEPINVYDGTKKTMPANESTEATFTGTLNSSKTANGTALTTIGTVPSTADNTSTATFYDAQGNAYTATISWYKCYVDSTGSSPVTSWYYQISSTNGTVSPSSGYVCFDSSGNMVTSATTSSGTTTFDTTPTLTITPGSTVGTAAFTVDCDLSAITTSNSTTGVSVTQDGYTTGTLSDIAIESDGTIVGTYSNGQTQDLAQLALAVFTNAEGLEKTGNNLYAASNNSGTVSYYVPGEGSTSTLSTGCLEMSNVDLAQEFSNMMIAQRAYQANSKVITTADEMLQSLINMR